MGCGTGGAGVAESRGRPLPSRRTGRARVNQPARGAKRRAGTIPERRQFYVTMLRHFCRELSDLVSVLAEITSVPDRGRGSAGRYDKFPREKSKFLKAREECIVIIISFHYLFFLKKKLLLSQR